MGTGCACAHARSLAFSSVASLDTRRGYRRPGEERLRAVSSPIVRYMTAIPRTIVTLLSGFVGTVVCGLAAWAVGHFRPSSPLLQRIIVAWSRAWLVPAGVQVDIRGADQVDPGTSYVVVANHRSNIDVMVCFTALPIPIRYLAKRELFRVPLLAQAMRAIGIVEVDRQHARDTSIIETVNRQAQAVIERGHSLIIYAEGTRTRDGAPRPFKKGAFTMAVASGMPVIPVAIHGSRDIWPPDSPWIHAGTVTVVIDAPIPTAGMGREDVEGLRAAVEKRINERLDQLAVEAL